MGTDNDESRRRRIVELLEHASDDCKRSQERLLAAATACGQLVAWIRDLAQPLRRDPEKLINAMIQAADVAAAGATPVVDLSEERAGEQIVVKLASPDEARRIRDLVKEEKEKEKRSEIE